MVVNKKTKTRIRTGTIILIISITLFLLSLQRVEIIYFTNPICNIANNTGKILQGIEEKFDDKVSIRAIRVHMEENDPPDTEEIKRLRERYTVYGVPEIIINGKEFTEQFTKYELEKAVCDQFIINPSACL